MTRTEVLNNVERRRRWSAAEKMRILEETLVPGVCVSEVARRNGMSKSLLFTWRRQARRSGEDSAPLLLPVELAAPASETESATRVDEAERLGRRRARGGFIEIELGDGHRVRVDADVDADALGRVLNVLARR
jgi:transposase